MSRAPRKVADNAVLHILNRGHDRGKLFRLPNDFKYFKTLIFQYKKRFLFDLYHYCLMSNHFHLLLRIHKAEDLSPLMKGICQAYAFYYKKQYHLSGYLFQNRYKSILIEKDEYLMECGRYIERNPVRAGIVNDPCKYHWSSYGFYAKSIPDSIITPDFLYPDLSGSESERRSKYIEYVTMARPYELLLDEKISELK